MSFGWCWWWVDGSPPSINKACQDRLRKIMTTSNVIILTRINMRIYNKVFITISCSVQFFQLTPRGFSISQSIYIYLVLNSSVVFFIFYVDEVKLFTPGPLNTSPTVKAAMLKDLGSRDSQFLDIIKFIRAELLRVAGQYEVPR